VETLGGSIEQKESRINLHCKEEGYQNDIISSTSTISVREIKVMTEQMAILRCFRSLTNSGELSFIPSFASIVIWRDSNLKLNFHS